MNTFWGLSLTRLIQELVSFKRPYLGKTVKPWFSWFGVAFVGLFSRFGCDPFEEPSIRGSCFKHTVYTELRMNDLATQFLRSGRFTRMCCLQNLWSPFACRKKHCLGEARIIFYI